MRKLSNKAKEYYDALLVDSNYVTMRLQKIEEAKENIDKSIGLLSSQIFKQNMPTLFEVFKETSFDTVNYFSAIYQTFSTNVNDFRIYHENNKLKAVYLLAWVLLVSLFVGYFNLLYRKKKLFVKKESLLKSTYFFIGRPISTALILIELGVVFIYKDTPPAIRDIELLIILIPFFRIMQTVIPTDVIRYFYLYFVLYFISLIEKHGESIYLENRLIDVFLSLSLIYLLAHVFYYKRMDFIKIARMRSFVYKVLPLFIVLSLVSLIANIYGMTLLTERIIEGIFKTIHSAIIFFVLTIILTGYLVIIFRRRMSTASNLIDIYATKLESIISVGIKIRGVAT